jgi:DNA polymerase I-like protein with 3'-5' exonuclease and polymerase domains
MARYIFDTEGNGLLQSITKLWIVALKDMDTGKKQWWLNGDLGWMDVLSNATLIVGHNVKGYDLPVLEKLYGFKLPRKVIVHDTMIMSLVTNYNRFPRGRHSLENWGIYLGNRKGEFTDFEQYSEEMLEYCLQDLEVTEAVYDVVLSEFRKIMEKDSRIRAYMRAEHYVAEWCASAALHGWPFDVPAATALFEKMTDELNAAYAAVSPILGMKAIAVDKTGGEVIPKSPKWTKQGFYDAHTARWFGIDPCSGFEGEERPIKGEYSRVIFEKLSLDSVTDVKTFLFRNGWEPTEWNTKQDPETRRLIKTSPKITEDSLEVMQGNGKIYCDFLTTKSRHGILKTWLANVDAEGNLHGDCFTIGTPSMRARHSIIVNVPSVDSVWGKEMRALFITKPGWKVIGCDSSGNQARGLAHYLKSPEYVDLLLNGDIHQYNADALTEVLRQMGIDHKVPRGVAKRILYAFLFGASGGKLWGYIFGSQDKTKGDKLKAGFIKVVPGFKDLLDNLAKRFTASKKSGGDGYITGLAGNKLYVDSFHKLLVYLLQACEKATCSASVMLTMDRLEAAGIPYQPYIMMHDEEDFAVPEEFKEQAAAIGKQAFKDGPEMFGITIMDGEAKIGDSWYDVH